MTAHARLSASGAHRWLRCPASISLEATLPKGEEKSSVYAEEGTLAHELAAEVLTASLTKNWSSVRLGQLQANAPAEMHTYVGQYVNDVLSRPGIMHVESRVSFDRRVPDGFGTADCIILHDGEMQVHDLKYGMGERVEAEDNEQLKLYALGVLAGYGYLYDIEQFRLVIHMPRLDHRPEWVISTEDLLHWGDTELAQAVIEVNSPNPRYNPGEKQCRWCKAKDICPALAEKMTTTALEGMDLDPPRFRDVATFTLEQCAGVLGLRKMFTGWMDAVEQRVRDALTRGESVPGWKFVAGRSSRAWRDESAAATALGEHLTEDALYTKKIITVAQAEKALGKKVFATLPVEDIVVVSEGAPTLAPESSKKQAVDINPTAGFDNDG